MYFNRTGIAVQLRVPGQGHKTACYGFDSSGMFLPDQTTAPIPPPLFAGRVSRYRQAADRYRQRQFRCPGRFFHEILLQNFRGCIRQIPDPPVWRGSQFFRKFPQAGCKWFIACLNMTGGRRIVFSGKRIFAHCAFLHQNLKMFVFPANDPDMSCSMADSFRVCKGAGNDFPGRLSLFIYDIQIFHVRPPVRNCVFGIQGLRELRSNEAIRSHCIIVYGAGSYKKQLLTACVTVRW